MGMRSVLIAFMAMMAFPLIVSAHASGASIERPVGNYFVDIGYDPAIVSEGDRVVFDFTELLDLEAIRMQATTTVDFDYVWVRLRDSDDATFLATGIRRADFGPTSLLMTAPDDTDELRLSVRYQKGEETLAEADFTIPVEPYREPYWWKSLALAASAGVIVASIVFALVLLIMRARRNVHNSLVRE